LRSVEEGVRDDRREGHREDRYQQHRSATHFHRCERPSSGALLHGDARIHVISTVLAHTRARAFPRWRERRGTKQERKKEKGEYEVSAAYQGFAELTCREERTRAESRCALERGSRATELSAALASYGRAFRRLRVGGRKKRRERTGGGRGLLSPPPRPSSARSRTRGDERVGEGGRSGAEGREGVARAGGEETRGESSLGATTIGDIFGVIFTRVPRIFPGIPLRRHPGGSLSRRE